MESIAIYTRKKSASSDEAIQQDLSLPNVAGLLRFARNGGL